MNEGPKTGKLTPDERLALLETCAKQAFGDRRQALVALTHKSYCNEHKDELLEDNERLEFLGDAVVDLAVGQRLMERFPKANEGELSKLRALIVNEEGLSRVSRAVGFGDLLLLGRGEDLTGGREKASVLADALEAVVGALYLGNGMPGVLAFIDCFFGDAFEGVAEGRQGRDNKSLLQEAAQQRLKSSPRYRVVSESGPEHEKIFEVEVSINGEIFARSTGRSKKEAEQAAAEKTLEMLGPVAAPH
jgi:ribonuclease III